jgi:hypothetical protein
MPGRPSKTSARLWTTCSRTPKGGQPPLPPATNGFAQGAAARGLGSPPAGEAMTQQRLARFGLVISNQVIMLRGRLVEAAEHGE